MVGKAWCVGDVSSLTGSTVWVKNIGVGLVSTFKPKSLRDVGLRVRVRVRVRIGVIPLYQSGIEHVLFVRN